MWMVTGIPSSDAAAQKGSSSSLMLSPPEGQQEMTTPLKPRALALLAQPPALPMALC